MTSISNYSVSGMGNLKKVVQSAEAKCENSSEVKSASVSAASASNSSGGNVIPKALNELLIKYREEGCTQAEILEVLDKLGIEPKINNSRIMFKYDEKPYVLTCKSEVKEDTVVEEEEATEIKKDTTAEEKEARLKEIDRKISEIEVMMSGILLEREVLSNQYNKIMKEVPLTTSLKVLTNALSNSQAGEIQTKIHMLTLQLSQLDVDKYKLEEEKANLSKDDKTNIEVEKDTVVEEKNAELEEINGEISEIDDMISAVSLELDVVSKQYDEIMDSLPKTSLSTLAKTLSNSQLRELQTKKDNLTLQLFQLKADKAKLEEINGEKSKIENIKDTAAEEKFSELKEIYGEISEIDDMITTSSLEYDILSKQYNEIMKDVPLTSLTALNKVLSTSRVKEIKAKMNNLTIQIHQLKMDRAELELKKDNLIKDEKSNTEVKNDTAVDEKEKSDSVSEKNTNGGGTIASQSLELLHLTETKSQCEQKIAEISASKLLISANLDKIDNQISSLNDELDDFKNIRDFTEMQSQELDDQLKNYEEQLSDLSKNQEMFDFTIEMDAKADSVNTNVHTQASNSLLKFSLLNDTKEIMAKINASKKAISANLDTINKQIRSLTDKLNDLKDQREATKIESKELDDQMKNYEEQLSDINKIFNPEPNQEVFDFALEKDEISREEKADSVNTKNTNGGGTIASQSVMLRRLFETKSQCEQKIAEISVSKMSLSANSDKINKQIKTTQGQLNSYKKVANPDDNVKNKINELTDKLNDLKDQREATKIESKELDNQMKKYDEQLKEINKIFNSEPKKEAFDFGLEK